MPKRVGTLAIPLVNWDEPWDAPAFSALDAELVVTLAPEAAQPAHRGSRVLYAVTHRRTGLAVYWGGFREVQNMCAQLLLADLPWRDIDSAGCSTDEEFSRLRAVRREIGRILEVAE